MEVRDCVVCLFAGGRAAEIYVPKRTATKLQMTERQLQRRAEEAQVTTTTQSIFILVPISYHRRLCQMETESGTNSTAKTRHIIIAYNICKECKGKVH